MFDTKNKRQEIATWISIIVGLLILFSMLAGMVVFAYKQNEEHQKYLDSLSPAELEAYYESNRARYEVISVSMYTTPVTNSFGGVRNTEVKYVVRYIDGNKIKEIASLDYNDFQVGDVNQYVIDDNTNERYVILTRETLEKIQ
jgi:hypothetical protein